MTVLPPYKFYKIPNMRPIRECYTYTYVELCCEIYAGSSNIIHKYVYTYYIGYMHYIVDAGW